MKLLHAAALRIPGIRRLREGRDALLADRDGLLEERSRLLARLVVAEAGAVTAEDSEARAARAEQRLIITEYAYHPCDRPIQDGAGGQRLTERLRSEAAQYSATLHGMARHVEALLRIPREEPEAGAPFWKNDWFPPFDAASLYGLIAERQPRRYIEVGSGISTRFARRAIRDLGLATRIVSIDPHPHTTVDLLCDEVVRKRMEDLPQAFWNDIGPDDLLFVDNSHRSFSNSDVTVFFADVLPALQPGTVYGLHDILLPWDYPQDWNTRFYNEQYLLMAYLLGGAAGDQVVLPVRWATHQPALHGILHKLWGRDDLFHDVGTHGGCFWMRRGEEPARMNGD